MIGASSSMTVMVNEHSEEFPPTSVAVYVTNVIPSFMSVKSISLNPDPVVAPVIAHSRDKSDRQLSMTSGSGGSSNA